MEINATGGGIAPARGGGSTLFYKVVMESLSVTLHLSRNWNDMEQAMQIIMCVLSCFSHAQLFATVWTVAHQAPLCMGFSRQEHWSGLPCPAPGQLLNPGIEPRPLPSPTLASGSFTTSTTWEAPQIIGERIF